MRHIPEEELHAYLDQALSRAQAVEIETHLAGCARCRGERDAIAGLRDRTTHLLSALAPAHSIQRPPYALLRRRHQASALRRANLLRGGIWAASLVGALSLGYVAHSIRDRSELAQGRATPTAPVAHPAPTPAAPVLAVADVPRRARPPVRYTGSHAVRGTETDTLPSAGPSNGLWRTESLERAVAAGYSVPRVAGLPVLQIQVQEASSPLVAVDQQLTSGETVRMIEGPAQDIAALDRSAVAATGTTGIAPSSVSIRTGNRMLLMTGRIPADSLRALLARLKTK